MRKFRCDCILVCQFHGISKLWSKNRKCSSFSRKNDVVVFSLVSRKNQEKFRDCVLLVRQFHGKIQIISTFSSVFFSFGLVWWNKLWAAMFPIGFTKFSSVLKRSKSRLFQNFLRSCVSSSVGVFTRFYNTLESSGNFYSSIHTAFSRKIWCSLRFALLFNLLRFDGKFNLSIQTDCSRTFFLRFSSAFWRNFLSFCCIFRSLQFVAFSRKIQLFNLNWLF